MKIRRMLLLSLLLLVSCLFFSCHKSVEAEKEFQKIAWFEVLGMKFGVDPKLAKKEKADEKKPELFKLFKSPDVKPMMDVEKAISDVSKRIIPSVVNIKVELSPKKIISSIGQYLPSKYKEVLKDYELKDQADSVKSKGNFKYGSGFVITWDGYIATNAHVVEGAKKIEVTLNDKRKYQATLIGLDMETNIAVIKIPVSEAREPVRFSDSLGVKIGQMTIVVGNQKGENSTVFSAIVSAVPPRSLSLSSNDDYVQISSPIYSAISGGPLVDLSGFVVGMNTSTQKDEAGVGLAIPSILVKNIVTQLIRNKKVIRSWLGAGVQNVSNELADTYEFRIDTQDEARGMLVNSVRKGSPAAHADIKSGDIIVSINEEKIKNQEHLDRVISLIPFGEDAKIKLFSDKKEVDRTISFDVEKPATQAVSRLVTTKHDWIGMLIGQKKIVAEDMKSISDVLYVASVSRLSPAYNAGIKANDLIIDVNGKPVKTSVEYDSQIDELEKEDYIRVLVKRKVEKKSENKFLVIKNKKSED
jgi:S1-C subfamily serine protease